jgi:exopolysaccharide production protein ExoQ
MPPLIATVVYAVGILTLFLLDPDRKSRASPALWLAVAWLLINGSRPLSSWLEIQALSSPDQSLEGSPLDSIIYLGLLVAGIVVLLTRQATVKRFFRANAPMLVFVLYCALSVSWSDYPVVAFKRWIKSVGDVVMILIALTDSDRSSAVKRLLARPGFVLIPVSILLIKYYPDMARYYSPWEGTQFVSGVATDKNMLGMTCLVFGLGAWWRVLGAWRQKKDRERTRRLIVHATILAMVIWLFWMADSMTSLSCFVLAGGLMTMTTLMKGARKPAVVHLLVAAAVGVSFCVLFLHVGGGALETMGRNPTLTGRTEIWKQLRSFSVNPVFGTGFQSFWLGERLQKIWATSNYLYGINESHNGYLEVLLNLGWIGVALLAVLIVTGYRNVIIKFRLDADAGRIWLAFFVAALVYGFTEASAFGMMTPVWIAFLLAITTVPSAPILKPLRPRTIGNLAALSQKWDLASGYAEGGESFRCRI